MVIIAKLDRLTRSVKDLCTLLERFERRGVALVSVAESLSQALARRLRSNQSATPSPGASRAVDDLKAAAHIGAPFHHDPQSPAYARRGTPRLRLRSEQRCHADLFPRV